MNSRKSPRWGNRRRGPGLGPGRGPRRRGSGGGKKGSCSFSLPLIPVAISRAALVAWQTWGVR